MRHVCGPQQVENYKFFLFAKTCPYRVPRYMSLSFFVHVKVNACDHILVREHEHQLDKHGHKLELEYEHDHKHEHEREHDMNMNINMYMDMKMNMNIK